MSESFIRIHFDTRRCVGGIRWCPYRSTVHRIVPPLATLVSDETHSHITVTSQNPQTYTIYGTLYDVRFSGEIRSIVGNFGDVFRGSYEKMFDGCRIDAILPSPPRSPSIVLNTTTTKKMFRRATSNRGFDFVRHFDTSKVTDMQKMFQGCSTFNAPIGTWDVSNVTNMAYMFDSATSFNQPIDQWRVHNVKSMSGMFFNARTFNQPIGCWRVDRVSNMKFMFHLATSFNRDIGAWRVNAVKSMNSMFEHATSFNRPISEWRVNAVESMDSMFENARSFDQDLSKWRVDAVTSMSWMFAGADSFRGTGLQRWNLSSVMCMRGMFQDARYFNEPIGNWKLHPMVSLNNIFDGADSFFQDLTGWARRQPNIYRYISKFVVCPVEIPPDIKFPVECPICYDELDSHQKLYILHCPPGSSPHFTCNVCFLMLRRNAEDENDSVILCPLCRFCVVDYHRPPEDLSLRPEFPSSPEPRIPSAGDDPAAVWGD